MNYSKMNKADLLAEINRRIKEGKEFAVDLATASKEDLVNALEVDDGDSGEESTEFDPLLNQVPLDPTMPSDATQPTEAEWEGAYPARAEAGGREYVFQVKHFAGKVKARVPAQASGHPGFFWEGTEEEAARTFKRL